MRSPAALTATLKKIKASRLYAGVELSLGDACLPFGPGAISAASVSRFAQAAQEAQLDVIVGLYSSWQDYGEGGWEHLPVATHVDNLKRQLDVLLASGLKPAVINVHRCAVRMRTLCECALCDSGCASPCSGSDSWTPSECDAYFDAVCAFSSSAGVTLSHETHRSRCLASPWVAEALIDRFPSLFLTADYSHWTVVSGLPLLSCV